MMSKVTFRQATAEDFESYFGIPAATSFIAVVGEFEGKLIGFGGASWVSGMWVAFMDIKADFKPRKRDYLLGTKQALALVCSRVSRLQACARDMSVAPKFLEHFGFVQLDGSIYRWDR